MDEHNKLCKTLQQKYKEIERLKKENQDDKLISSINMLVVEYNILCSELKEKKEEVEKLCETRDTAINNYNESVQMYNDDDEKYCDALTLTIQALLKQKQIDYTEARNLISEIKGLFTELEEEQNKQSLSLK